MLAGLLITAPPKLFRLCGTWVLKSWAQRQNG
jgi:hypothetical protein